MRAANRLDEVPLAHLGTTRDPLPLSDLVELLAIPVLQALPGLPAAPTSSRGLLAELPPRRLGHVRDRALATRGLLRLLDVAPRSPTLLRGGHQPHLLEGLWTTFPIVVGLIDPAPIVAVPAGL